MIYIIDVTYLLKIPVGIVSVKMLLESKLLLQTLFYIVNVKEKKIHFFATVLLFFASSIPLLGPFLSGANLLLFCSFYFLFVHLSISETFKFLLP